MKTKADFLANMSHEIRTPLNAIIGFIEILKKDETDAQRQKYFDIINSSGQDLLTIINDILDFSKIQSGKVEIEYIPINLSKSFKDTQLLFFEKAKEKDINLELNISSDFPEYVLGDSVKIKQVLSNLISNAIKFTPKNKYIYIDADYKDGYLNVFVKDEGIGIDKKIVPLQENMEAQA
ncbi:MAG: ATP-binding protein [Sulfurimonas sp.]|nr:ATP-binding protein [Sulfurimonas sp.]